MRLVAVACAVLALALGSRADDDCWGLCFDSAPGKLTSTISFASLADAAAYNDAPNLKKTYEVAFGLSIGIFNTTTKRFIGGSSVKSVAARRAADITFTATVHPDLTDAATTSHSELTAATLVAHIDSANTMMGHSVSVPTAEEVSGSSLVPPPTAAPTAAPTDAPTTASPTTSAPTPAASLSSDDDKGGRIMVAIIVSMLVLGAIASYFLFCDRGAIMQMDKPNTAPVTVAKAEMNGHSTEKEGLEMEYKEDVPSRMCC